MSEGAGRETTEELLRALIEATSRRRSNHGGIEGGGESTNVWRTIALGALSLNMGLLVWGLQALVQLREDVAVLKCEVNPACMVISNGHKPP